MHIAPPTHPNLQFDPLVLPEDRLDLEVDADSADKGRGERVVGVAEEEGGLADGAVADDEELEHVVEVLVRGILLPGLSSPRHLQQKQNVKYEEQIIRDHKVVEQPSLQNTGTIVIFFGDCFCFVFLF